MTPSEDDILVVAKVLAPEPWEHYVYDHGGLTQAGKSYLNRAKSLLEDRSNALRDVLVAKLKEDGVLTEQVFYTYEDEPDINGKKRVRKSPLIDPERAQYFAVLLKKATFWRSYATAPISFNPNPRRPGE